MPMRPVFSRAVFNKKRALPRMSWSVENLYNLWQRTGIDAPLSAETSFRRTSMTLFQQRWRSKRFIRGYHGDHIGQTKFERWYLPEALPSIHSVTPSTGIAKWVDGRNKAGGRSEEDKLRAKSALESRAPIGTMMFREVERRIDVLVFRACFASSVWAARQLVVHGKVLINGKKISNPNTRLQPGDLFTVDAKAMTLLRPPVVPEKSKSTDEDAELEVEEKPVPEADEQEAGKVRKTYFNLPPYAQPHIFIPAYLLPSFLTCSAVYVRHPTARPGYSEIPSPYDADGEVMSLGWEFFKRVAPRMRGRRERWMDPERSQDRK